jgi:hypothetical protein
MVENGLMSVANVCNQSGIVSGGTKAEEARTGRRWCGYPPFRERRGKRLLGSKLCAVESINYHLELTPPQLKITHTALRSLLDDFGHDERDIHALIHEVLAKLPDEHAIRAIQLDTELRPAPPSSDSDPEPPPGAAA